MRKTWTRYTGKVALVKESESFYKEFKNRKEAATWLVENRYAPTTNAAKVQLTYAVTGKNHKYKAKPVAYGFSVRKIG